MKLVNLLALAITVVAQKVPQQASTDATIKLYGASFLLRTLPQQNPFLAIAEAPSEVQGSNSPIDVTVPEPKDRYVWKLTGYFKPEKTGPHTFSMDQVTEATFLIGLKKTESHIFDDMITDEVIPFGQEKITVDLKGEDLYPIRITYIGGVVPVGVYVSENGQKKDLNEHVGQISFKRVPAVSEVKADQQVGSNTASATVEDEAESTITSESSPKKVANPLDQIEEAIASISKVIDENITEPVSEGSSRSDSGITSDSKLPLEEVKASVGKDLVNSISSDLSASLSDSLSSTSDGVEAGTLEPLLSDLLGDIVVENGDATAVEQGVFMESGSKSPPLIHVADRPKLAALKIDDKKDPDVSATEKNVSKRHVKREGEDTKASGSETSTISDSSVADEQRDEQPIAQYYKNGFAYAVYLAPDEEHNNDALEDQSTLVLIQTGFFDETFAGIKLPVTEVSRAFEILGSFQAKMSGQYSVRMEKKFTSALQIGAESETKPTSVTLDNTWQVLDTRRASEHVFDLKEGLYYPFRVVVLGNGSEFEWKITLLDPTGAEVDLLGLQEKPISPTSVADNMQTLMLDSPVSTEAQNTPTSLEDQNTPSSLEAQITPAKIHEQFAGTDALDTASAVSSSSSIFRYLNENVSGLEPSSKRKALVSEGALSAPSNNQTRPVSVIKSTPGFVANSAALSTTVDTLDEVLLQSDKKRVDDLFKFMLEVKFNFSACINRKACISAIKPCVEDWKTAVASGSREIQEVPKLSPNLGNVGAVAGGPDSSKPASPIHENEPNSGFDFGELLRALASMDLRLDMDLNMDTNIDRNKDIERDVSMYSGASKAEDRAAENDVDASPAFKPKDSAKKPSSSVQFDDDYQNDATAGAKNPAVLDSRPSELSQSQKALLSTEWTVSTYDGAASKHVTGVSLAVSMLFWMLF